MDDKRDINESKTKDLLVKKINEFKENNYSLELLSKLCAKEKSSYLGRVLSDYWDDDNFDKNVFASLYKCQSKHEMAIEYIEGLARRGVDVYTNVREIFSPSAGRAEKDIAEGYKDNAEFLSIKYPKTADVFFKMSQSYVYDSDLERRRAENGYF